jgi:hypothetical protein
MGKYRVSVKACNEVKECVTNSFNIIVSRNLTTFPMIIGLITGIICTVTLCCALIGGGGIILKCYRNKILRDKNSINVKGKDEFTKLLGVEIIENNFNTIPHKKEADPLFVNIN